MTPAACSSIPVKITARRRTDRANPIVSRKPRAFGGKAIKIGRRRRGDCRRRRARTRHGRRPGGRGSSAGPRARSHPGRPRSRTPGGDFASTDRAAAIARECKVVDWNDRSSPRNPVQVRSTEARRSIRIPALSIAGSRVAGTAAHRTTVRTTPKPIAGRRGSKKAIARQSFGMSSKWGTRQKVSAAAFGPQPGSPGKPSARRRPRRGSPGSTPAARPIFANTPASSRRMPRRRSNWTTRLRPYALRQILVGSANRTCATRSRAAFAGGGGQRIVGLVFDHRPDHHAHRIERFFQHRELRQQRRRHAFRGLVSGIEIVAERFDHVIGRDADVRRAASIMPSTDASTPRTAPTSRPLTSCPGGTAKKCRNNS